MDRGASPPDGPARPGGRDHRCSSRWRSRCCSASPSSRAVSVGFYLVGSFLTIAGFFVGNRGPVRLKRDVGVPLLGSRFVRWATPEEREESINTSAIYVVLGFALIFLGVLADTRYSLV